AAHKTCDSSSTRLTGPAPLPCILQHYLPCKKVELVQAALGASTRITSTCRSSIFKQKERHLTLANFDLVAAGQKFSALERFSIQQRAVSGTKIFYPKAALFERNPGME